MSFPQFATTAPTTTRTQALVGFRSVVGGKKNALCMHYISTTGCPLGSLCPNRHVGANSKNTASESCVIVRAGCPVRMVRSPTYSTPLCPSAEFYVRWFWGELPAVSGSSKRLAWRMFNPTMSSTLEQHFLANEGHDCSIVLQGHEGHSVDFRHMMMFSRSDGGSRRPIQRVEISSSPLWLIEELHSAGCGARTEFEGPLANGGKSTFESPFKKVSVDQVSASFLEYQYCSGKSNILSLEINGCKVRVDLMTMLASELPNAAAVGAQTQRRRQSQRALPSPSSQPNNTKEYSHSPVVASRVSVSPPISPQMPGQAAARSDQNRKFRLHRQPITIRAACESSNVYNVRALECRSTFRSTRTGEPLEVLDASGDIVSHDTTFGFGMLQSAELDPLAFVMTTPIPREDTSLLTCNMGATCSFESSNHIWSFLHRCPNSVHSSQCYLCAALIPSSTDTSGITPSAGGSHPWRNLPTALRLAYERSETHLHLFQHDVPLSQDEARVQQSQHRRKEESATTWRRNQKISKWFRSEWDTPTMHQPPSAAAAAADLASSSTRVDCNTTTTTTQISSTINTAGRYLDLSNQVCLHNVRQGSQELEHLSSLMRNEAVESRQLSFRHPPEILSSPKSESTCAFLPASLTEKIVRALSLRGTMVESVSSCIKIQRVQHAFFLSRYLRARAELFAEWQQHNSEAAEACIEECMYRVIPRSWLHSLLYGDEELFHDGSRMGSDETTTNYAKDRLRETSTRWYFFRDLEAALTEPTIPGLPHVLLTVVAYAGVSIRLPKSEAASIAAPPLALPWHLNDELDDGVRRYLAFQSVTCDVPFHGSRQFPSSESEAVGSRVVSPNESMSSAPTTPRCVPTPPRPPSSTTRLGQSIAFDVLQNSDRQDAGKMVYLYDVAQWCPMYLISV